MFIDSARICCTGCGFETREVYRPIQVIYRLDNGDEVQTGRVKGWCHSCNDYTNIEDMEVEKRRSMLVEKEQERQKLPLVPMRSQKDFLLAYCMEQKE